VTSYFKDPRRDLQFRLNNSGNVASSNVSDDPIRVLGTTKEEVYFYFVKLPKRKRLARLLAQFEITTKDSRCFQVRRDCFDDFLREL